MRTITTLMMLLFTTSVASSVVASAMTDQTFTLQPGWNAIHLEVDPDDGNDLTDFDRTPQHVFSAKEIEMVWVQPDAFTTAQYIDSPSENKLQEAGWRVFIPEHSQQPSFLTNLFAVNPGQVYLVKVSGNTAIQLSISGRAHYQPIQWQANAFNLVGFYVDPENSDTFANLLNLDNQQFPAIYSLDENSDWSIVPKGKNALVESGKGYWIYNDGSLHQSGALDIPVTIQNGFHFFPQSLVSNLSLTPRSKRESGTVTYRLHGNTPVHYFSGFNEEDQTPIWSDLSLKNDTLSQGQQITFPLSVDRNNLTESVDDILEIKGFGMRIRLPFSAEPLEGQEGLWMGSALINQVTHVALDGTTQLEKSPAPLQVKLIVHLDKNGQTHLLKQVYVVREKAEEGETADVALVTEDRCLSQYNPLHLTNRVGAGIRHSSVAFDFEGSALPLSGSMQTSLTGTIVLNENLPTNPMKHKYHKDHDDNDNATGAAIDTNPQVSTFYDEVWDMTREIKMTKDTTPAPTPETGLGQLIGDYSETIKGIHQEDIEIRGRFILQRVNQISELHTRC